MKIFTSSENVSQWKVIVKGPKGSDYEKGNFLLFVDLPPIYPFSAP
jgi:ubiquitin-protein ligase